VGGCEKFARREIFFVICFYEEGGSFSVYGAFVLERDQRVDVIFEGVDLDQS
jgi:hypothetical protein